MADKVTPWEDYHYSARLPDFYQIFGGMMGLTTMCVNNAYRRLPVLYKPLVNIPLFLAAGVGLGTGAKIMRERYMDNKIRISEAYIQAHPEDFVEPPPKRYGDVLWQWDARR